MENNAILHEQLKQILDFDRIEVDGSTNTKGDTFGIKGSKSTPISIKNASGKNTQVHLTTLTKLAQDLSMPADIKQTMDRWLGTRNTQEFQAWAQGLNLSHDEISHNRIKSHNLANWSAVESWFNERSRDLSLPRLLIQSLHGQNPARYLVWVNKKKPGFQIIDVNKLVEWIGSCCYWKTMTKGTVIRCFTPTKKAILWLQMKGNRESYGHNHSPQFHIVSNWPKELVVYENSSIQL